MQNASPQADTLVRPRLGMWDAVSIIVGIVVGTSIFRTSSLVFAYAGGPWTGIGLWALGGLIAWCGAVCYAELATSYPQDGGDYEYLNRAFGPGCGFLFAWSQLTTVISANIAIMAYAFADYATRSWPAWREYSLLLTIAPVVALSLLNAFGIVAGKVAQNFLTATKVLGLTAIIFVGLLATSAAEQPRAEAAVQPLNAANIGLALVFALYAYGGWSHAAYVAAEVRDQRRNLPRALVLGIVGITVIYLAINASYLNVLGYDGLTRASAPAADVLEQFMGQWAGRVISVLVMLSALGAINGMILTGSRIYAVWGADYRAFHWLASWNRRTAAPIGAIVVQAAIALVLILLVGTESGRRTFDTALRAIGRAGLPWDEYNGGFATLVAGSAPLYWLLTLLTGLSVFILRRRDRGCERPFAIPLFPIPAIVFAASCAYMFWASITYARWLSLIGFLPTAVGGALCLALRSNRQES
jgi:amino acid transporter